MAKKLCKSHIGQLRKVATSLAYKQTMNGTQLIVGLENRQRIERAETLIYTAINLLEQIE